jgi:hypothetical protein
MTKTYTAKEFEISFYEAMSKWLSGGKVGPDPRGEIEFRPNSGWNWSEAHADQLEGTEGGEYRWKQPKKRTVVIDGVELVAPEVDAPAIGTPYYTECSSGSSDCWIWDDDTFDREALKNAKVFLSSEYCQAMADAQHKQRMGGAS